jgi:hypothetical protein
MRFSRFHVIFGHVVSHYQWSKICPKLPKFAKIYPKTKLWNTTKNWDLNFFQKYEFVLAEEALEHVSTIRIFNPRFFHMLFLLSKNSLCMWISAYPFVQNDVFLRFHKWIWDFVDMHLTHLGTRIWSPSMHTYSIKWFFWPPKLCCIPWAQGKELLFNFEPYDLANNMEWMCKIWWTFKHTSSYKILRLEVQKKASILHNLPCFQEGLFWGSFGLNAAINV